MGRIRSDHVPVAAAQSRPAPALVTAAFWIALVLIVGHATICDGQVRCKCASKSSAAAHQAAPTGYIVTLVR